MNDIIRTSVPVTGNGKAITRKIARFWDRISPAWKEVWGPHIHHGYYDREDLSPVEAQERLIEKLVERAKIERSMRVLDAGCGMGGSSIYLASRLAARVSGVTLSSAQAAIARLEAQKAGVAVDFRIGDAHELTEFENGSFDLVWSLESCEQFYDKPRFLSRAYQVLTKGGRLMLATWCASADEYEGRQARAYRRLCAVFDLPYMPSIEYYRKAIADAGFSLDTAEDWTGHVERSWELGIRKVRTISLLPALFRFGPAAFIFSRQLALMRDGFAAGMVRYGVFVATKET